MPEWCDGRWWVVANRETLEPMAAFRTRAAAIVWSKAWPGYQLSEEMEPPIYPVTGPETSITDVA